jgi:hypothetical protein
MNRFIENVIVSAAATVVIARARLNATYEILNIEESSRALRDYNFAEKHFGILKKQHGFSDGDILALKPRVLAVARKMMGDG